MAIPDRVAATVAPLVAPLGLALYDVEIAGGVLRITVESESGEGVTLDTVAEATKKISRTFDEDDPMPGGYTLEVSSPGLERKLRKPAHFEGAVGEEITVKLGPHVEGPRRLQGELLSAAEATIVIETNDGAHEVALADITKAKTVFEWGPTPKPGSPEAKKQNAKRKAKAT